MFDYSRTRDVAGGSVDGMLWSLVEVEWLHDIGWHCGRWHYFVRVDASEYGDVFLGAGDLLFWLRTVDMTKSGAPGQSRHTLFNIKSRSPGIQKNGYGPTWWLEAEIASYFDEERKLRSVVETGFDWSNPENASAVGEAAVRGLWPYFMELRKIKERRQQSRNAWAMAVFHGAQENQGE